MRLFLRFFSLPALVLLFAASCSHKQQHSRQPTILDGVWSYQQIDCHEGALSALGQKLNNSLAQGKEKFIFNFDRGVVQVSFRMYPDLSKSNNRCEAESISKFSVQENSYAVWDTQSSYSHHGDVDPAICPTLEKHDPKSKRVHSIKVESNQIVIFLDSVKNPKSKTLCTSGNPRVHLSRIL